MALSQARWTRSRLTCRVRSPSYGSHGHASLSAMYIAQSAPPTTKSPISIEGIAAASLSPNSATRLAHSLRLSVKTQTAVNGWALCPI